MWRREAVAKCAEKRRNGVIALKASVPFPKTNANMYAINQRREEATSTAIFYKRAMPVMTSCRRAESVLSIVNSNQYVCPRSAKSPKSSKQRRNTNGLPAAAAGAYHLRAAAHDLVTGSASRCSAPCRRSEIIIGAWHCENKRKSQCQCGKKISLIIKQARKSHHRRASSLTKITRLLLL